MTDGLKEALKDAQKQPQTNFQRITASEEALAYELREFYLKGMWDGHNGKTICQGK